MFRCECQLRKALDVGCNSRKVGRCPAFVWSYIPRSSDYSFTYLDELTCRGRLLLASWQAATSDELCV